VSTGDPEREGKGEKGLGGARTMKQVSWTGLSPGKRVIPPAQVEMMGPRYQREGRLFQGGDNHTAKRVS
jgi:hypothetical protein